MRAQALLPAHTAPELLLGGIFFLFLAADVSPQKLWFVGDGGRPGEVMRAQARILFTQLMSSGFEESSSSFLLLYLHRNRETY